MDLISVVIPCFNEEESVPVFFEEFVKQTLTLRKQVNFEYIFVDDGSKDHTLQEIKKIYNGVKSDRVKYVSFSRNFGKEAALYAGLQKADGDYVAVMDVDLQDPPELLNEMYSILKTGDFDCVATRRSTRAGEPKLRSAFARAFYKLINRVSETEIVDGARDFRLMNRKMVLAVLALSEKNRFSKGIFSWVGFKTKWLSYENIERKKGTTKWSFWKLFKYAIEGFLGYSSILLMMPAVFVFLSFLASVSLLICSFVCTGILFPMLCGISIGIFLLSLFMLNIGLYLSKINKEVKNRPIYLIREEQDSK